MITEIEHTSAKRRSRLLTYFGLGMNVLWLAVGLALGYFIGGALYLAVFLGLLFLVSANVALLVLFASARGVFDTLNFKIALAGGSFEQRRARFLHLLEAVEMYFGNTRVSARRIERTGKWWQPAFPLHTAFELPGFGLTLKTVSIYEDRGGLTSIAFILGPVVNEHDNVARKLLEGLRQELLRFEEKDRPKPGE